MIKVVIADDHPIVCEGVKAILEQTEQFGEITTISDEHAIITEVKRSKPEILIIDLELGERFGLDIIRELPKDLPVKTIILSMHKDQEIVLQALENNVLGYITKDVIKEELIHCIESVLKNEIYVSKTLFEPSVQPDIYFAEILKTKKQLKLLSKSERNILKMISTGNSSQQIADRLFISLKTVENHRGNICKKLDIHGHNALLHWVASNQSILKLKL